MTSDQLTHPLSLQSLRGRRHRVSKLDFCIQTYKRTQSLGVVMRHTVILSVCLFVFYKFRVKSIKLWDIVHFWEKTPGLNLPLSDALQVILSSMIKECEIKVENRGMADAQGWERNRQPVPFLPPLRLKQFAKHCFSIAWKAATATFQVEENLVGERILQLWREGSRNSSGPGPALQA